MASKSTLQVGVEDRISQLPDDVLVHILSFLPTVDSVGNSILSKRWNNLWKSVPTLDFDQQDIGEGDFDSFATFVERALTLHNSSSTIRKFRLHFLSDIYLGDKGIARVRNWICTALSTYEVGEIDISLFPRHGINLELKLPRRLFLCKTLEVLRVKSNCITYPSTKPGYFPSLKFADVTAKHREHHCSMRQLFCNCPVLEELFIEANIYKEDFEVNISAPELKTLRTRFCDFEGKGRICINAPKLENLVVSDKSHTPDGLTNYNLKNAKSLVDAKIDLYIYRTHLLPSYLHLATALLAGVSGVKYLSISGPNLLACSLPTFNNLKQLKLLLVRYSYWGYVMELLKQSPKLEDLVLDINIRTWYDEEYVEGYEPFKPPEIVPICVVSHLKTISITNFMGYDDELDVVKYLFKYGEVLKKITISTSGPLLSKTRRLTEQKLQKKLLKYQKSSKSREVEVKFLSKEVEPSTCRDCGSRYFYVRIL